VCAALGAVVAGGSPASPGKGGKPFPQVIQLPPGFQPEGIEVGRGTTYYVARARDAAGDVHQRRRRDHESGVLHGLAAACPVPRSDRPRGGLGNAQTIPLVGDYVHVPGAFNLNGIDAT
jgi:hypothetical protein